MKKLLGPISEEYFDQLSTELGDEWTRVAVRLGHDKAAIQRICQSYAYLDGNEATQKCVKNMLVDWFKASEKSKYKVSRAKTRECICVKRSYEEFFNN